MKSSARAASWIPNFPRSRAWPIAAFPTTRRNCASNTAEREKRLRRGTGAIPRAGTDLRATLVGPHRDDLQLLLNEKSAAQFGSEGQKRTLAIALKMAQAEFLAGIHGSPPFC
jgi:recombinational DNA repair ATPase RecF